MSSLQKQIEKNINGQKEDEEENEEEDELNDKQEDDKDESGSSNVINSEDDSNIESSSNQIGEEDEISNNDNLQNKDEENSESINLSQQASNEQIQKHGSQEEFIFSQKKKKDGQSNQVISSDRPKLIYEDFWQKEVEVNKSNQKQSSPSISSDRIIRKLLKLSSQAKHEIDDSKPNDQQKNIFDLQIGLKEKQNEAEKQFLEREKTQIAHSLGLINQGEIKQYDQMLEIMADEELPENFVKEYDPQQKIIYFNKDDKISSYDHPFINRYRKFIYEKKFKEDEIDFFKLENRKNIPTKFSHHPIIHYGKHDKEKLVKQDSLKESNPKSNVKEASTAEKQPKEAPVSNSKRSMSKSIYKTKSISGKITKSIGGMGDINQNKQKIEIPQLVQPNVPVINPALMFTDIKIGTLNPKQEYVEQRYKEMMNELTLMKDTDSYRFLKERIYPNVEENEEEDNENRKEKESNNKDISQQQQENGQILKQEQQISNINIYHKALLTIQQKNGKNADKKNKQKSGSIIRSGLGFFAQTTMSQRLISIKNIPMSSVISGAELSETTIQGQSLVALQETTVDQPQFIENLSLLQKQTSNNQHNSKKESQSSTKKFDINNPKTRSGLSSSTVNQNETTPKQNIIEGELQEQIPPLELKQEKQKQEIYQIDIYSVRCEKDNLVETIEKELIKATGFYEDKYGRDLFIQQQIIEQQKSYLRANPEDVINAMNFLNIQLNQPQLFWVARAFASLDLPDFWTEIYDEQEEQIVYVDQLTNFHFNIHPAIIFVQKIITQYKAKKEQEALKQAQQKYAFKPKSYLFTAELPKSVQQNLTESNNNDHNSLEQSNIAGNYNYLEDQTMIFEDKIGRQYSVSLTKLSQKLDKINMYRDDQTTVPLTNKLDYITNTLNNIRRKEARQVAPINPYYDDIYFYIDTEQDVENKQVYDDVLKKRLPQKHRRSNSNLSDQHLLVLSNELGLNFPDDMHLLILVDEFIEQKEATNNEWRFRQTNQNTFYWYNPKDSKSQVTYPFLQQLRDIVTLFQHSLKRDISKIKINKENLKYLKMFHHPKEEVLIRIKKESKEFVKKYIENLIKISQKRKNDDNQIDFTDDDQVMATLSSSEEEELTHQEQNDINNEQKRNNKKRKFKVNSDGYQLKHIMDILRNKSQLTERDIKDKLLFNWPLKFIYKQHDIKDLNSKEKDKEVAETKDKPVQINLKESSKSALKKIKAVSKVIGMTRSSTKDSIQDLGKKQTLMTQSTNTTVDYQLKGQQINSASSIGSSIRIQRSLSNTQKKPYPPTSYQIMQNPVYFIGKTNQDQYKFSSDSSDESNSSKSKSTSRSNSLSNLEQSESMEMDNHIKFYKSNNPEIPDQVFLQNLIPQQKNSEFQLINDDKQSEKRLSSKANNILDFSSEIVRLDNQETGNTQKQNLEQINENVIENEIKPENETNIQSEEKPQERYYDELIDSLQNQEFKQENIQKQIKIEDVSKTIDSTQINNDSTQVIRQLIFIQIQNQFLLLLLLENQADISQEKSKIHKQQDNKKLNQRQKSKVNKGTPSSLVRKASSKTPGKDTKKGQEKKISLSPNKQNPNLLQQQNKIKLVKINQQEQTVNGIKSNQKTQPIVQQQIKNQTDQELPKQNNNNDQQIKGQEIIKFVQKQQNELDKTNLQNEQPVKQEIEIQQKQMNENQIGGNINLQQEKLQESSQQEKDQSAQLIQNQIEQNQNQQDEEKLQHEPVVEIKVNERTALEKQKFLEIIEETPIEKELEQSQNIDNILNERRLSDEIQQQKQQTDSLQNSHNLSTQNDTLKIHPIISKPKGSPNQSPQRSPQLKKSDELEIDNQQTNKPRFSFVKESQEQSIGEGSPMSRSPLQQDRRGSFRWKLDKKSEIQTQQASQKYIIPPKIDESQQSDKKSKSKIEDSYKSLFENHFKDKAKQMNLFQQKQENKNNNLYKYIQQEMIIDEDLQEDLYDDEDYQNDKANSWIFSQQQQQLNKNFIVRQMKDKIVIKKRFNQLQPLNNNINTIYSQFQRGSLGQQIKLSGIELQNNNQSNRRESNALFFYPEIKSQQTYINHQLRNQFYQATLQQQKLKNEIKFIDQFNSNFIQQSQKQLNSNQQKYQKLNSSLDKNNIEQQQEKQQQQQQSTVRKILIFPTFQQPTKRLVPHFSPKVRMVKTTSNMNFKPSRSVSPKTQALEKNIQNKLENGNLQKISSLERDKTNNLSRTASDQLFSNSRKQSIIDSSANYQKDSLKKSQFIANKDSIISTNKDSILSINKQSSNSGFAAKRLVDPIFYSELNRIKDSKEDFDLTEQTFKSQIDNISKYQDDYSNFKIKQMLSDLLKKMPYVKLDFQNQISSKILEQASNEPNQKLNSFKVFQIEAKAHLELIKVKFLKKKLDLIAFDFIMLNLRIPKEAKKTIYDSEILKARLYRRFRNFFRDIRGFLMSLDDIYKNLQRMIVDSKYEMRILSKLFGIMSQKFQRQIIKINKENVFEKIILFYEKKKINSYILDKIEEDDAKKNQDEELADEILISDIESDPDDQNDLNPFSQQFTLVSSKVLNKMIQDDKRKQRKRKKLIKKLEKGQKVKIDSDEEKEYLENVKAYKEQMKKKQEDENNTKDYFEDESLSEQMEHKKTIIHIDQLRREIEKENERKIFKEIKKQKKKMMEEEDDDEEDEEYDAFDGEIQKKRRKSKEGNDSKSNNSNSDENSSAFSSYTESSDSDSKTDIEEETNRISILLKVFDNPKYIFLFQQFLQTQEKIIMLEETNQIWKLLINQIGHVHTLFRDCVKRVEVFLDYGFTTVDFEQMVKKLNIDIVREGDLLWIAYFYCGILLRFSSNKTNEVLQAILQSEQLNDYDSFFLELIELNRVKRQFVMIDMNSKNKDDFLIYSNWFKFYSKKNGQMFFYNPVLKKKVATINKKVILLQEQLKAIEKYKFIEMIDFIMNKIKDEEERDLAMQFNIMFQTPIQASNKDDSTHREKKSILHYKNASSIRGSIRSIIESNPNITNTIKSYIQNYTK